LKDQLIKIKIKINSENFCYQKMDAFGFVSIVMLAYNGSWMAHMERVEKEKKKERREENKQSQAIRHK